MYVCLNVSLRLCFLHKKIQKHSFSVCISYAFPSFFYLPARIFLCKRYMNKFLGISFLCFNRLLTWNIDQMMKKKDPAGRDTRRWPLPSRASPCCPAYSEALAQSPSTSKSCEPSSSCEVWPPNTTI